MRLAGTLIAAALVLGEAPVAAADAAFVVEAPRAFGHAIGDRLRQSVRLPQRPAGRGSGDADGSAALLAALPPGRAGRWVERLAATPRTDRDGTRWLDIDYQVVNAPPPGSAQARATLPGWRAGDVEVAAWSFGVVAIVPQAGGVTASASTADVAAASPPGDIAPPAATLQPLHGAQPLDAATPRRAALRWLAALAVLLIGWFGWWRWREHRDAHRGPFEIAWRRLRTLDAGALSGAAAWAELHHALNASAGRVLQAAGLPSLIAQRPELAPLQQPLRDFYAASAARLFAPPLGAVVGSRSAAAQTARALHATDTTAPDLLALAAALRRAERQAAR